MPLTHNERLALAHAITAAFTSKHHTVLAGLYGSTARDSDTPWSDLELLCIVENGERAEDLNTLYRGIAVGARVYTVAGLEEAVTRPDGHWPMTMGILSTLQVLHGDPDLIDGWLDMGRTVPQESFTLALKRLVPTLVFESCGRIRSCAVRGSREDLSAAILETVLEMNTALCLINRRWARHDYYAGLLDVLSFPSLPRGYAQWAPALWKTVDLATAAALADRLLIHYVEFLTEQGIEIADLATVPVEEWIA
jgi:kanamycin nucleotidyltransferase